MDNIFKDLIMAVAPVLMVALLGLVSRLFLTLRENKAVKELGLNRELVDLAEQVVVDVVIAINQTIVDAAKEAGKFDRVKAKEVFFKAKNEVIMLLSPAMIEAIKITYKDFDVWLETKIESIVNQAKDPVK